jgi:hypothetical protein
MTKEQELQMSNYYSELVQRGKTEGQQVHVAQIESCSNCA